MESPKQNAWLLDTMCTQFSTYQQSALFPTGSEYKSLVSQFTFWYGGNKQAPNPILMTTPYISNTSMKIRHSKYKAAVGCPKADLCLSLTSVGEENLLRGQLVKVQFDITFHIFYI